MGKLRPAGRIRLAKAFYLAYLCLLKPLESAENFSGGPIQIEPVYILQMEEFLKFGRFKRECVKMQGGMALSCPSASIILISYLKDVLRISISTLKSGLNLLDECSRLHQQWRQ